MNRILCWLLATLIMVLCIIVSIYELVTGENSNTAGLRCTIIICSFAFICDIIELVYWTRIYIKDRKEYKEYKEIKDFKDEED